MAFPKRIYTNEEVKKVKELVNKGYKHRLRIKGSPEFKLKMKHVLELVKTAGYYDFLRTYIRRIEEINGLTQLRNADAIIWANKYTVENHVDAASLLVQKANVMQEYLELKHYYSGEAEKRSVEKRVGFLKVLKEKSQDNEIRRECERLLKLWDESSLIY